MRAVANSRALKCSPHAVVATVLLLLCPVLAHAQGRAHASSARQNTLQICHTLGNGGFRMMEVNPSSEPDHIGHGDWHPMAFFEDADGDGFGGSASILACALPAGHSENDLDCDDNDPTSYPGAVEILGDNRDNDCDGWIDEGWPSWGRAATEAARIAARTWMAGANVRSSACHVNGAIATAGTSSVSGPSVTDKVKQALLDAGASSDVASGWDLAFRQAWNGWSASMTIPGLPWYPTFLAWPGPQAAPTPNVPMPLAAMVSVGRTGMTASSLAGRVESSIGSEASEAGAKAEIDAFARAIARRFDLSLATPVPNVRGWGPVPTYSPPWVPVGPVIGGRCSGGDFPTSPWN